LAVDRFRAAQNMVWFYKNNVGVGRTKVKRVEMEALVKEALASSNQLLSEKHEDSSLWVGVSSLILTRPRCSTL
jgi:hypothetical protein